MVGAKAYFIPIFGGGDELKSGLGTRTHTHTHARARTNEGNRRLVHGLPDVLHCTSQVCHLHEYT